MTPAILKIMPPNIEDNIYKTLETKNFFFYLIGSTIKNPEENFLFYYVILTNNSK